MPRDAIVIEAAAAQLANLKPEQRDRLVQIQLQAQGPLAFSIRERDASSSIAGLVRFTGPPLSEQLKMSDDQVKRVRTIAEEGTTQILKAASFRSPWIPRTSRPKRPSASWSRAWNSGRRREETGAPPVRLGTR